MTPKVSKRKKDSGTDFEMHCRNARRLLGYAIQHTAPGQENAHLELAEYQIKQARLLLRGQRG